MFGHYVPVLICPLRDHDPPALPNGLTVGDVAITSNLVACVDDNDVLHMHTWHGRQRQIKKEMFGKLFWLFMVKPKLCTPFE